MEKYKVLLNRSYVVTICAESEYQACMYTEYFIGDCGDLSGPLDRKEKNFEIEEIELTINEAIKSGETSGGKII